MAQINPKPFKVKGAPASKQDIIKTFKLSKSRVAWVEKLVAATPGLHDSADEILKRYEPKAVGAGS